MRLKADVLEAAEWRKEEATATNCQDSATKDLLQKEDLKLLCVT
jgi:hypothetical protein